MVVGAFIVGSAWLVKSEVERRAQVGKLVRAGKAFHKFCRASAGCAKFEQQMRRHYRRIVMVRALYTQAINKSACVFGVFLVIFHI